MPTMLKQTLGSVSLLTCRCFVHSLKPLPARPLRRQWNQCDLQTGGRGTVILPAASPAVASQAGSHPPRAGKKKVKKLVDINGDVVKDLGNGMFQLKLENGVSVMAHLSGKIRQNRIKILVGDKVIVELSPYDLTRGRITYRYKPGELAARQQQQQQQPPQ